MPPKETISHWIHRTWTCSLTDSLATSLPNRATIARFSPAKRRSPSPWRLFPGRHDHRDRVRHPDASGWILPDSDRERPFFPHGRTPCGDSLPGTSSRHAGPGDPLPLLAGSPPSADGLLVHPKGIFALPGCVPGDWRRRDSGGSVLSSPSFVALLPLSDSFPASHRPETAGWRTSIPRAPEISSQA